MKLSRFAAVALSLGVSTWASADWSQIQTEAKGQTVYFNAWGGAEAINAYIAWAAKEAKNTGRPAVWPLGAKSAQLGPSGFEQTGTH